jgi:gamma-butyrobetaine dioxygenase
VTGQRLLTLAQLPASVSVRLVGDLQDRIDVVFEPGGHGASFARSWLASMASTGSDWRSAAAKSLWQRTDLAGSLPTGSWPDYAADEAEKLRCLRALAARGAVLLRGVPCREGAVLAVAESFGYVRETNYGRLFDVRVETDPNNLAFTDVAIAPHTDNPYRNPAPTVQLLHCLSSAAVGGETGLVDGFSAALELRGEHPEEFDLLTRFPVSFAFDDAVTSLRTTTTLIEVRPGGDVVGIRFNDRSMRPVLGTTDEIVAFARAYGRLHTIISRADMRLELRLAPGDCLVLDNTRILHARTAFATAGARHLQGCYADLDGLGSSIAVLERGPR